MYSTMEPKKRKKSKEKKKKAVNTKKTSKKSSAIVGHGQTLASLLEEEDDDNVLMKYQSTQPDQEDELFGLVRSDIVGVQYYKGTVSNNEMVNLVREPDNRYDCNAVKVENMGMEQVGHIKKEHAKALSQIMDKTVAKVEGIVPYGAKNKYRMPIDIYLWGTPNNRPEVVGILRSNGITLSEGEHPVRKSGSLLEGSSMDYGHVVSSRIFISPAEMQNELDKMFETLEEGDKTTETKPVEAIRTSLYPHQKQALNWMICKENNNTLPPFWEKQGNVYANSLTMFVTKTVPASVHGGILADDMGLGKTLEIISLIMSNFIDGKPLACPVPGRYRSAFGTTVNKVASSHLDLPSTSKTKDSTFSPRFVLNKTSQRESESKKFKCEDPEFEPRVPTQSKPNTEPVARSRRNIKRPVYYTIDDSDEEDQPYVKKRSHNKMGVKKKHSDTGAGDKGSTPTMSFNSSLVTSNTTENNKGCLSPVEDMLDNQTDTSNDSKSSAEVQTKSDEKNKHSHCDNSDHSIFVLDSDDDLPDILSSSVSQNVPETPLPLDCDSKTGRTQTYGPRGTLIICPLSVMSNWVSEFEKHVLDTVHIQVYVYYGPSRCKDLTFLKEKDVVVTTYSTLASEYKMQSSPILKIEWLRVVLDEGHMIRNPQAVQTKAAFELKAQRRWILTGTPIQNSLKDLWSLVNFLKVKPFTDKVWWNRTIVRPLSKREKPAMQRVCHLMKNLAMRRTKNQQINGKPILELPARKVFLEKITLSGEERSVYDAMQNHGQVVVGRYFQQGTLLHHYGEVLAILIRLRQLCCHPLLVAKAIAKVMESNPVSEEEKKRLIDHLMNVLNSGSEEECSICLESLSRAVITSCAHVYCRPCIEAVIDNEQPQPKCPLCRGQLDKSKLIDVPPELRQDDILADTSGNSMYDEWQSSAKVDALMKALTELRKEDPTVKSVVVSQFTSLLTLLEIPLKHQGFAFSRLDGTMSRSEREQAVSEFSSPGPNSPTIFLLSMKAGGVGINLTAASRVFLMDPAWNPAVEDQCFDRCHRLGQTQDVIITRFVIEDSIEERMLELQEKKTHLMKVAFGKQLTAEERRRNIIDDIKGLLQLNF
ncbi:helicase-like transcription factor [Physella acuta]|uniref:helicase-like transcription factor n=1 Tax=Physella acuta TaxID=109671 RepID=UPI0027DC89E5|nr:helicase-like transcription factor [Physella acuta]